jgi:hypothetical protein
MWSTSERVLLEPDLDSHVLSPPEVATVGPRHVGHEVLDAVPRRRLALPARAVRDERPRQQTLAAHLEHLRLDPPVAALRLLDDALNLKRVEDLADGHPLVAVD